MAKVEAKANGESQQPNLTPKQEAFARAYVETGNASEAYRRSYNCKPDIKPETVWVKSCELLAHGKVSARVEELKQEIADRHDVTVDYLTAEYREAMMLGKSLGQIGPTVSAITALGKLHGLITDKLDHTHKHSISDAFEEFIRSMKRPEAKTIDHESKKIEG
jgi:phage terminase small subunit